jgi:PIN domain nuclease of toxin-antitoxin system
VKRFLLDTHIVLWWAQDNPRLSTAQRTAISDPANEVYVSAVSVWEASIKSGQGKLVLPTTPLDFFHQVMENAGFLPLSIQFSHAAGVRDLPAVHSDPFDRLLIAQARVEGMTIVSDDRFFQHYELPGLLR